MMVSGSDQRDSETFFNKRTQRATALATLHPVAHQSLLVARLCMQSLTMRSCDALKAMLAALAPSAVCTRCSNEPRHRMSLKPSRGSQLSGVAAFDVA